MASTTVLLRLAMAKNDMEPQATLNVSLVTVDSTAQIYQFDNSLPVVYMFHSIWIVYTIFIIIDYRKSEAGYLKSEMHIIL